MQAANFAFWCGVGGFAVCGHAAGYRFAGRCVGFLVSEGLLSGGLDGLGAGSGGEDAVFDPLIKLQNEFGFRCLAGK